jgi:hypothetical protein
MSVDANCVRKCDALEFVKLKSVVGIFPIWKETRLIFTAANQRSLDFSTLVVIIWDHEKGEFIDPKSIDATTFASTASIYTWIKSAREDWLLSKKLSDSISSGFISILQVKPRDVPQVCFFQILHYSDHQTRL